MNTVNVFFIFLINHTKSHRTSFILIYELIIPSQTVFGNFFEKKKPLAKGLEKPPIFHWIN